MDEIVFLSYLVSHFQTASEVSVLFQRSKKRKDSFEEKIQFALLIFLLCKKLNIF